MIQWMAVAAMVAQAPATIPSADRQAIEAAMLDSAAGWNAGDLDRFLRVYSDDSATSFTGAKGIERGKSAIRARYIASYPAIFGPQAARGAIPALTFVFEDVRALGSDHALLTARWRLVDAKGEQSGMTTLVFRRERAGWRIIADHSS